MNETPGHRSPPGERSTGGEPLAVPGWCIHDLAPATCGICTRHPDLADTELQVELGAGDTGWGYYDELHR